MRHLSYAAICAAAASVIAAGAGWPWGLPIGLAFILIAIGLRLVWRDGDWQHASWVTKDSADLGTLTTCTWCSDTGTNALYRECACTVPCHEITWCRARNTLVKEHS